MEQQKKQSQQIVEADIWKTRKSKDILHLYLEQLKSQILLGCYWWTRNLLYDMYSVHNQDTKVPLGQTESEGKGSRQAITTPPIFTKSPISMFIIVHFGEHFDEYGKEQSYCHHMWRIEKVMAHLNP